MNDDAEKLKAQKAKNKAEYQKYLNKRPINYSKIIAITVIGILFLSLVSFVLYMFAFRDTWEMDNIKKISRLISVSKTYYNEENFETGIIAYDELCDFIGDKELKNERLKNNFNYIVSQYKPLKIKLEKERRLKEEQKRAEIKRLEKAERLLVERLRVERLKRAERLEAKKLRAERLKADNPQVGRKNNKVIEYREWQSMGLPHFCKIPTDIRKIPRLKNIKVGDYGKIYWAEILQIVDDDEMIVKLTSKDKVRLKGFPTRNLVNGREWGSNKRPTSNDLITIRGPGDSISQEQRRVWELRGKPPIAELAIIGTWRYTTVIGSENTILTAVPLDFIRNGLTMKEFEELLK